MTKKRGSKKPTSVQVKRLDNGNISVRWNAPIKVSTLDLSLMGYQRSNKFLTDDNGKCIGFEMHLEEYADMCAKRLNFNPKLVMPTPGIPEQED